MVKYPGMDPPMMPGWVYGIALRSGGGNIGKTMSKLVLVRMILKTNASYYDNIYIYIYVIPFPPEII